MEARMSTQAMAGALLAIHETHEGTHTVNYMAMLLHKTVCHMTFYSAHLFRNLRLTSYSIRCIPKGDGAISSRNGVGAEAVSGCMVHAGTVKNKSTKHTTMISRPMIRSSQAETSPSPRTRTRTTTTTKRFQKGTKTRWRKREPQVQELTLPMGFLEDHTRTRRIWHCVNSLEPCERGTEL